MNHLIDQIAEIMEDEYDDLMGNKSLPDQDVYGGSRQPFRQQYGDENGNLPPYAWPGGYHIIYITDDSGILCHNCANSQEAKTSTGRDGWLVTGMDALESSDMYEFCDHCGYHFNQVQESVVVEDQYDDLMGNKPLPDQDEYKPSKLRAADLAQVLEDIGAHPYGVFPGQRGWKKEPRIMDRDGNIINASIMQFAATGISNDIAGGYEVIIDFSDDQSIFWDGEHWQLS